MAAPKGIRTRSTPDWFARFVSTGTLEPAGLSGTHFYYISLYNDSTIGAYLSVHWLMAIASQASAMLFYFRQGMQGNFDHHCSRINPSLPAPPGSIYFLDNGTNQIADTPVLLQSTFTGGAIGGGAPMLIVPPGYSLMAGTNSSDGGPGVTFQYVPFLDVLCRQAI